MNRPKFRVWAAGEMHYPAIITFDATGVSFAPDNGGGGMFRADEAMMATGILDVTGKPIYEGDILNHPLLYPLPVVWNEEIAGFCRKDHDGDLYVTDDCEIIGNVYEHPHLWEPPC